MDAHTRIGDATEIRLALLLRTSEHTFNKRISDSPLYLRMPVTHPVLFLDESHDVYVLLIMGLRMGPCLPPTA